MKDPLIEELQKKRDAIRFIAYQTRTDAAWDVFRTVRNIFKSAIRTSRKSFIEKALYSTSPAKFGKSFIQYSKPSFRPLRFDHYALNDFFVTISEAPEKQV